MIDLKQFCAEGFESATRSYLSVPFSSGEFTYATNGHVCVRVARRDDAGEAEGDQIKCVETLCKTFDEAKNQRLASFARAMPDPLPPKECEVCGGGEETVHDCPDCECECEDCDGTGKVWTFRRVRFESFDMNEKYLRMLAALPGLKVGEVGDSSAPVLFSFDEGIGLVMPMLRDLLSDEPGILVVSDLPPIQAASEAAAVS